MCGMWGIHGLPAGGTVGVFRWTQCRAEEARTGRNKLFHIKGFKRRCKGTFTSRTKSIHW